MSPVYGELRAVSEHAGVLLCENPSLMTLEGTNTWVLRAPGERGCVVVDPGPLDEAHLQAVAACGPVLATVLTHGHDDHAAGARRFAEITGSSVRAVDPQLRLGSEGLAAGEVVEAAGVVLSVLPTPGHTGDSVSLVLSAPDGHGRPSVLTGDTVLGRGTTVIDPRTGDLGDYLDSLRRLAGLGAGVRVLPGHGPELDDAAVVAAQYLEHRQRRLDQVRAALEALGPHASARQVVELVYADVDESLWPAAEWSVQAQLAHLRRRS